MTNEFIRAIITKEIQGGRTHMICLIASNNIQGYYADTILRICSGKKVHSHFPSKFNFGEVGDYIQEDDDVIIVLGFGYRKSEHTALINSLEQKEFYNLPFTGLYHFASWGDVLEADSTISSFVDEEKSPVRLMKENLASLPDSIVRLNKQSMLLHGIVKDVEGYHTYSFHSTPKSLSLELKLLGDAYRGHTGAIIEKQLQESLDEPTVKMIFENNKETIQREKAKMLDYIQYKTGTAKAETVGEYVLVVLYAEEYTNELAHEFIANFTGAGFSKVIVMIGKHTKGDDMFNIRVSEGLDASMIAKGINNGKGKKQAATVFLGNPTTSVTKSLHQQLLTFL